MDNKTDRKHYRICFDSSVEDCPWYVMGYDDGRCDEQTREHVGVLEGVEPVDDEDETELRRALREEYPHTASGDVEVIRERRVKRRHGTVSAYSFDERGNPRGTVGISVSSVALPGSRLPPRYSIVLQDGAGRTGYDMTIDAAKQLAEFLTAAVARLEAEEVTHE